MRQLAGVADVNYAVEQLLSRRMLLKHEVCLIKSCYSKSLQLQRLFNYLLAKPATWLKSILKTLICSQVEDARAIIKYIYVLLMETNSLLAKATCATFNNDDNDFELKHATQVVVYEWFNIFNFHYTWNLSRCNYVYVADFTPSSSTREASLPGDYHVQTILMLVICSCI